MSFGRGMRAGRPPRKGAIFVGVLVALVLVACLMWALTRNLLSVQRQTLRHQWSLQSLILAEAGLERAKARLERAPDYAGERWEIAADPLVHRPAAVVEIRILSDNVSHQHRITSVARFPLAANQPTVQQRSVTIPTAVPAADAIRSQSSSAP